MFPLKILFSLVLCFYGLYALPRPHDQDYREALKMSLLFFEAQRSGKLPASNRIHWRNDSALNDKGDKGEDLEGGYYDANDFVKFNFNIAFSMTMLSWGFLSYKSAYKEVGQEQQILDAIKWGTDYLKKCHVKRNQVYVQVGSFKEDHKYYGRPEEINTKRPAFKIGKNHLGSDVAAEISAALASGSLVFRDVDKNYSEDLLESAKEVFNIADKYRGFYKNSDVEGQYQNAEYVDEIIWASSWLYRATLDVKYKNYIDAYFSKNTSSVKEQIFDFSSKNPGTLVLYAQDTNQNVEAVLDYCNYNINTRRRTRKGLLYIKNEGTLPLAANVAFLCLQALDIPSVNFTEKYINFARQQLNYMLGSTGRSYVVGFGREYPLRPIHVASTCPDLPLPCGITEFNSEKPNPQILYGALVSGPNHIDYYQDDRNESHYNAVTIDFNAGFQSALAGLIVKSAHKNTTNFL